MKCCHCHCHPCECHTHKIYSLNNVPKIINATVLSTSPLSNKPSTNVYDGTDDCSNTTDACSPTTSIKPTSTSSCCPTNNIVKVVQSGNKLIVTMDDCTFYEVPISALDKKSLVSDSVFVTSVTRHPTKPSVNVTYVDVSTGATRTEEVDVSQVIVDVFVNKGMLSGATLQFTNTQGETFEVSLEEFKKSLINSVPKDKDINILQDEIVKLKEKDKQLDNKDVELEDKNKNQDIEIEKLKEDLNNLRNPASSSNVLTIINNIISNGSTNVGGSGTGGSSTNNPLANIRKTVKDFTLNNNILTLVLEDGTTYNITLPTSPSNTSGSNTGGNIPISPSNPSNPAPPANSIYIDNKTIIGSGTNSNPLKAPLSVKSFQLDGTSLKLLLDGGKEFSVDLPQPTSINETNFVVSENTTIKKTTQTELPTTIHGNSRAGLLSVPDKYLTVTLDGKQYAVPAYLIS